jgi:hypothetical protein
MKNLIAVLVLLSACSSDVVIGDASPCQLRAEAVCSYYVQCGDVEDYDQCVEGNLSFCAEAETYTAEAAEDCAGGLDQCGNVPESCTVQEVINSCTRIAVAYCAMEQPCGGAGNFRACVTSYQLWCDSNPPESPTQCVADLHVYDCHRQQPLPPSCR